jgi:hypothetical protein
MANIIKTYTINLEHFNLPTDIAFFFKYKSIQIKYECTWNSDEGYYKPINLSLIKVSRNPDQDDEKLGLQNIWNSEELPDYLRQFFESGLLQDAECQIDRPFVVE